MYQCFVDGHVQVDNHMRRLQLVQRIQSDVPETTVGIGRNQAAAVQRFDEHSIRVRRAFHDNTLAGGK